MKKILTATVIFSLLFVNLAFSSNQPFEFTNKQYREDVLTVLLHPQNDQLADPVLNLNELGKLSLSFDVLGDFAAVYYYTLIHCSYDWKASDIPQSQYLTGYHEDEIRDYRFSINTLTPYINYTLSFPTELMVPGFSGNYLLVVYDRDMTEGNILLTRRFRIVDPIATVHGRLAPKPRNLAYAGHKQQIDVEVHIESVFNMNPHESIKLVIKQNGRDDNAVRGLKASHIFNDRLVYEYTEETVFDGGNQFRNFDMKSFKYQSERIQAIFMQDNYFMVRLWPDKRRTFSNFVSEPDIHGRKFIQARPDQLTNVEGDYAWVEFFLEYPAPLTHGDMHILGGLNDFRFDMNSRMTYNFNLKAYEGAMFLKQGYYNYMYAILEKGQTIADVTLVEGDHWETLNEYAVMVYYRRPGTRHDQLIGYHYFVAHQ